MSTSNPPPGWYPDQTPGQERYWDGSAWTTECRPASTLRYPPPPPQTSSTLSRPLADYGQRLGGWLIDLVVVGIVSIPFLLVFHAVRHSHTVLIGDRSVVHQTGFYVGPKGILIQALIVVIYGTIMCGSSRGQTLGMMALHVRVVDIRDGGRIGFVRAFVRAVVEYVMAIVFLVPWIIDVLYPLWDPARQTLHDKAAAAIVINSP